MVIKNTWGIKDKIIKTEKMGTFDVVLVKTDWKFPYKIKIFKGGKEHSSTLNFETMEEIKGIFKDILKDISKKAINRDSYRADVKHFFTKNGFVVSFHRPMGFYDDEITVRKNGVTIGLTRQDIDNESYKAVSKYFNHITNIYNKWKDGGDIFYSTINSIVDSKMKSAKSSYRNIVFSKIVDLLRKNGVDVHS